MLIGLVGLAGSGKSEVARVLVDEAGFRRAKFGNGLKNMLRALLATIGYDENDIERYIEGDLKESIIPELGVTSRQAQIDIGENGRRDWGEDVWARVGGEHVDTFPGEHFVFDDVRRPNEAAQIKERGGELWRVERPGVICNGHETERHAETMEVDRVILNDGELGLLRQRTRTAWMFIPPTHRPGTLVPHSGVPDPYSTVEAAE